MKFKHVRLVSKKLKENVYIMELVCWSMKGISTYTLTPKNLGDEWCKQISRKYLSKQLKRYEKHIHKSFQTRMKLQLHFNDKKAKQNKILEKNTL